MLQDNKYQYGQDYDGGLGGYQPGNADDWMDDSDGPRWKKYLVIGLAAALVIGAAGGGWWWFTKSGTGLDTTADAYICRPKDGNTNRGLELYLDDDHKTIVKAVYKDGTDEAELSEYLERIGATDESLDAEFNVKLEDYAAAYYNMMNGNENLAWFTGEFSFNPGTHDVLMKGTVDLTNELLEPEQEDTWNFLSNMGLTRFYDTKAKKFMFTKDTRDAYLDVLNGMAECVPVTDGE